MTQALGPNQEAWLAALESGRYKQGKDRLRDENDCYCCLGVACEVLGLEAEKRGNEWAYCDKRYSAPEPVVKILRLYSNVGSSFAEPRLVLTELNDSSESFSDIAKRIRANPHDYFSEPN